jgi:hypothetical protein
MKLLEFHKKKKACFEDKQDSELLPPAFFFCTSGNESTNSQTDLRWEKTSSSLYKQCWVSGKARSITVVDGVQKHPGRQPRLRVPHTFDDGAEGEPDQNDTDKTELQDPRAARRPQNSIRNNPAGACVVALALHVLH